MRATTLWWRLPENERWATGLIITGTMVVSMLATVPAMFDLLPTVCVLRRFGGFCPGCGLTRACVALARLDFVAAARFNVLVFLVVPFVFVRMLDIASLVICGRARCIAWPHWLTSLYQVVFICATGALATIRLTSWLLPACNPGGFGLPPAGHP
jgi:hypothetical protein